MKEVYVVNCCRTAIGSFGGSLKDVPAAEMGAVVMKEALNRAGVKPEQVDEVMFGCKMCIRDRGTTVLVSSHNLRELEDVCDHVGILSHGKVLLERSLTELQDNIIKLQLAFQEPGLPPMPEGLNVLHTSQIGRVYTLIVRGDPAQIKERMAALNPILMEMLPLNLEEIFIYELSLIHI